MTSFTLVGNQRYDYDYDANGNLTCMHDLITPESYEDYSSTLSYNLLNLPLHLTTDGDDYIDFRYLADGTKVSAIGYEDYGFKYAGPFRYRVELGDAFIESSEAAGGRIWCYDENDPDTPAPETRYFITDHLGSTRVVLKGDGTLSMKADYLPYGGLISGSGLNVTENDYLWTGKELQHQLFDTPSYDSSARLLFTNGLFASPDPLAEKYPGISPYAYCAGNPVLFHDPDGRWPKLFKSFVKIAKTVLKTYKQTGKIRAGAAIVLEVNGIVDDFKTLSSDESSYLEKGFAVIDLSTGFGNEAEQLFKAVGLMDNVSDVTHATYSATKNRVKLRKSVKATVLNNAKRNANGELIDPNTGKVIPGEGPYDIGHIKGESWAKRKKDHERAGHSRREVIEAENDPRLYQIEDPS